MAGFREFKSEAYYEAPDTNGLFAHTMNTIHGQMAERAREKRANRTAAERFKIDNAKGFYTADVDVLNKQAGEIVSRARNEIRHKGQLSGETDLMMQDYQTTANQSKVDFELAKSARAKMKELAEKDKYYTGASVQGGKIGKDEEELQKAEYEGPISERNQRIQDVLKNLGGIETFNKGKYVADHIQKQKLNKMQQVTDGSGVKTTRMTSAIFMKPDGTPGVTDEHVVEMFNSEPRVEEWYNTAVNKQLTDEVGRMKALGSDPRVSWMVGMDDEDIKAALINNPTLNLINGTPFGQRKKEMARADLSVGQDINRSTSVDYSDSYGASGGKFNNTKIGYQPTFIDQAINFRSINGAKQAGTVGADLTYIDKGGPLKFVTNTPIRANVGTGEVDTKASDNMEFNLRNYGLYVYDTKGQLYPIQGKSLEELKNSIDAIPDRYFSKNATHPLSPEMSIGLNGFAINKSKLITQSLDKLSSYAEEYNKALDAGDEIKAQQLKSRMDQVQKLRTLAGNADVDDMELLMTGKQLGISGVQNDLIVKASDQDFAKLRTMTNGLDLRNTEKWTEDMRELNDHYKKRALAAQSAPPAPAKQTPKVKTVTSDGTDVAKWKTTNEYKVGDKIYFYDNNEGKWKKK